MKNEKGILGAGLLSAVTASLCCITPVLALVAGTSGMAATFSWIEPFRSYFIGITILTLGFAWYQKLKPQKQTDCECETDEKKKFIQTKTFLGIVTLFAATMISFPNYAHIFYPKSVKEVLIVKESNIQKAEFKIEGMTCTSCAEHVQHDVNKLPGIILATASYENNNAVVEFDNSKTTLADIQKAIDGTGYKVIEAKIK
jgi:copper chaperone CopZ